MASSFDPEAVFVVQSGEIVSSSLEVARCLISAGRVPVFHGGTVWDLANRFQIVSSDQIVEHLACALRARRVIWATDVEGVLRRDDAGSLRVIRRLSRRNCDQMERRDSDRYDCTGGMTRKVDIALRLADRGIRSLIGNGARPGMVCQALRSIDCRELGTLVEPVSNAGHP